MKRYTKRQTLFYKDETRARAVTSIEDLAGAYDKLEKIEDLEERIGVSALDILKDYKDNRKTLAKDLKEMKNDCLIKRLENKIAFRKERIAAMSNRLDDRSLDYDEAQHIAFEIESEELHLRKEKSDLQILKIKRCIK